jgi:hypothetical protein
MRGASAKALEERADHRRLPDGLVFGAMAATCFLVGDIS